MHGLLSSPPQGGAVGSRPSNRRTRGGPLGPWSYYIATATVTIAIGKAPPV